MEDLCRFGFSSPLNYPILLTVKTCLHKSFLSQPRFLDAVVSGFKTCVARLKENNKDSADDVDLSDFLTFCSTRLELKQSSVVDKSVVVAASSKEPILEGKPSKPAFASADKKRVSENKFLKNVEANQSESEEEEEAPEPVKPQAAKVQQRESTKPTTKVEVPSS